MSSLDQSSLDLDDDDLRRRFDAIAARALMPVVDPMADLQRARDARRRRRVTQLGGGLVAAVAVSVLVISNLPGGEIDAGGNVASNPSSGPTAVATPRPDLPEIRPEVLTFRRNISGVLGADQLGATGETGSARFDDDGALRLVAFEFLLPRGVTVDVRGGVSREALEWRFATDTSSYAVGTGVGEQGMLNGKTAFIYDQPGGDIVLVAVDGPLEHGPSTEQINALLTDLDVPASTPTPAP